MESQNARRHILGAINCIDREIENKQREKRKLRDILLEMDENRSSPRRDAHRRRQSPRRKRSRERDSYRSTRRANEILLRSRDRDFHRSLDRRTSKKDTSCGETVINDSRRAHENSRETNNKYFDRASTINSISITVHNKSKHLSPYGKHGCCYCGDEHFPHQCVQVRDPIERRAKFESGNWCINCGLHKKKESVQCRQNPPICEICKSEHLTVLHEFKKEMESPIKSK